MGEQIKTIIKLLMCTTILFLVACDDDGGSTVTLDQLQGTWYLTQSCASGSVPTEIGCIDIGTDCDYYNDGYEYIEISGNQIWDCEIYYDYNYDCDYQTFTLSGNSIVMYYYGQNITLTINMASNGQSFTLTGTIPYGDCSVTMTDTYER